MYRFRTWIRTRAISFSFKIACENISFSSLLAAGDVSRFTRRFLRAKRPKWRTARRNECFRRLHSKQIYMKLFNIHFPLFYFNIIRNRLRVIMHRHKKKKKEKKKKKKHRGSKNWTTPYTAELLMNSLSRHWKENDVQNYIAHDEIPQTYSSLPQESWPAWFVVEYGFSAGCFQ